MLLLTVLDGETLLTALVKDMSSNRGSGAIPVIGVLVAAWIASFAVDAIYPLNFINAIVTQRIVGHPLS